MIQLLLWWLILTLLGLTAFPISFWLFQRLPGRGYAFSRALGLLLSAYLLWVGASLHVLQNDLGGITFSLLAVAGVSLWLALRPGGSLAEMRAFLKEHWRLVLGAELLFTISFLAWAGLRAAAVDKIMPLGGEKFMEMAFLKGILNSRQFPPLDPWLSDYAISYYYFGYVMQALLTRLSGALAGVAFDLYDALLFALTSLGAYGLVHDLCAVDRAGQSQRHESGPVLAGLLGALLTAGMGNLQGILEVLYTRGWLPQGFAGWLGVPGFPQQAAVTGSLDPGSFFGWAWRASRVLDDLDLTGKPVPFQPITEFPAFSFLLGDNHPHVLALPFALLAAAACFQLLLSGMAGSSTGGKHAHTAALALVIGALAFLNTWDYPIYLGLALLAFLAGSYTAAGRLSRPLIWQAARLGFILVGWTAAFYFLFFLSFRSQAGGVLPYLFPPTRLAQYLVMFGPFVFILAFFLPASLNRQNAVSARPFVLRRLLAWWLRLAIGLCGFFLLLLGLSVLVLWLDQTRGGTLSAALSAYLGSGSLQSIAGAAITQRINHPWLFLLVTALLTLAAAGIWSTPSRSASDDDDAPNPAGAGLLFARLLALLGLALTFSVEFFYLRDGFNLRMNTVFKFYFQGWVMMACASAYALWWMSRRDNARIIVRACALAGSAILILAGTVYLLAGASSRTNAFASAPDLDGTSNLRRENPDDWAAIDWLEANGINHGRAPLLLEAPGKSYNYEGRISAFTGYPSILGWSIHEMQWRGDYSEQARREVMIAEMYTTPDGRSALSLLLDLGVDYVVLGAPERAYIRAQCSQPERSCNPALAESKFAEVLTPVFQQGDVILYAVPGSK